ncbi:MAG: nuclease-related domain-containing protein [Anaerolineae bacterium]
MKIVTNEELIAKRKKLAGRVATASMILLVGGLVTNCTNLRQPTVNPTTYYLLLTLLFTGFVAAVISSHLVSRWVKEPRADQVLAKVLRNFDNNHHLFNYTTKAPHVLLAPGKLFVISPKNHEGLITCRANRWKRPFKLRRLFFLGEEALGNPAYEAQGQAERLRKFLDKQANGLEIPDIQPVIVFTHPDVKLDIEDPAVPAMKGSALKEFVRKAGKGTSLTAQQRRQLIKVLSNG